MGRPGRREEVGYTVLWLASDEASYLIGTELVVESALLAQSLPADRRKQLLMPANMAYTRPWAQSKRL